MPGRRPPHPHPTTALLAALLTLAFPACDAAPRAQAPGRTPAAVASPATPPRPTATRAVVRMSPTSERSLPLVRPPASTLTYAGQTQTGRINSYTWTSPAGRTLHADIVGLLIPDDTLTLPPGAIATFQFGGTNPPVALTASAHALADPPPCPLPRLRCIPWREPTDNLPRQLTGTQAAITLAVPPGEYLVVVEVTVHRTPTSPEQGKAPYSFRIAVRE